MREYHVVLVIHTSSKPVNLGILILSIKQLSSIIITFINQLTDRQTDRQSNRQTDRQTDR